MFTSKTSTKTDKTTHVIDLTREVNSAKLRVQVKEGAITDVVLIYSRSAYGVDYVHGLSVDALRDLQTVIGWALDVAEHPPRVADQP